MEIRSTQTLKPCTGGSDVGRRVRRTCDALNTSRGKKEDPVDAFMERSRGLLLCGDVAKATHNNINRIHQASIPQEISGVVDHDDWTLARNP